MSHSANRKRKVFDRLPPWLRVLTRWVLGLSSCALIGLFLVGLVYFFLSLAYDLDEVAEMPARTLILDRQGEEMLSLHGENRRPVSFEELPDALVRSLLVREDARFFEHPGVDALGVLRALQRNLKDGEFSEGASTISMQLTRNSFEMREMSLHRKLLEAVLTLRLESRYTKKQILAHYLNRIYFGSGCYGIQEASLTYFGRPVSDLHEGECALLAGIIRGPHIFSPFRNLEAAMEQRDQVIARLVDEGEIELSAAERFREMPLRLVPPDKRIKERSYALQWVRRELEDLLDEKQIQAGGLLVKTCLDQERQRHLEKQLAAIIYDLEHESDWPYPVRGEGVTEGYLQCAALAVKPGTGEVLAVIGGRNPEESYYNRALFARRDLGRAFAPFVNAAVAERNQLIIRGKTVATGRQIGPKEVARIAARLGLESRKRDDDLYRGAVACSPRQLTQATAALVADGQLRPLYLIDEILDQQGRVLFRRKREAKQVLSEIAAQNALEFPPYETRGKAQRHLAWSFGQRDLWLSRIRGDDLLCLWLGFDQPQPIPPQAREAMLKLNE